jgi:cold-inducible RNA-binding protein
MVNVLPIDPTLIAVIQAVFVILLYKRNYMKLFIAGLSSDLDDIDLKEMMELYGEVSSAKVIMDRETGKSRGFGFVDMPNDNDAKAAIETLDGAGLKGKKLSVKEADEQQRGGGGGGNRGGSGGGGGRGRDDRGGRDDRSRRY